MPEHKSVNKLGFERYQERASEPLVDSLLTLYRVFLRMRCILLSAKDWCNRTGPNSSSIPRKNRDGTEIAPDNPPFNTCFPYIPDA